MSANLGASRSQESLRVRFQKAFGRTAIPWFDDHSAFLIFRRPEDVTVRYWFFEPTIDYTQPFHPDMSRAIGKYMLAASRVRTATVENDRTPEEFALLIKDYGSSRVHLKSFLDPTKDVESALDQFDSSHCTHMAMASLSIKIRELPEAIRSSAPSEEQVNLVYLPDVSRLTCQGQGDKRSVRALWCLWPLERLDCSRGEWHFTM